MKLVTFVLLAATIEICASLTCSDSCKAKRCARLAQRLDCVGNLVKDACGCCYECAKQLNNTCGGIYNANGICDAGLACYHIPPSLPALHPGICSRKVQCHVYSGANYGQWIDVGQSFTLTKCKRHQAEVCVCKSDGTFDCKKQEC